MSGYLLFALVAAAAAGLLAWGVWCIKENARYSEEWRHGQHGGEPCVRVRLDESHRVITTDTWPADRCPERRFVMHFAGVSRRREIDAAVEQARARHAAEPGLVQPPTAWPREVPPAPENVTERW